TQGNSRRQEVIGRADQVLMLLEGIHCTMSLERPSYGVVVVRIRGSDTGELGDAPFEALDEITSREAPISLFIDARDSQGVSIGVSEAWSLWLMRRQADLSSITMLTGSRL